MAKKSRQRLTKLPTSVQKYVNRQAARIYRWEAVRLVSKLFNQVKKDMIAEFMTHPVTIEIMDGIGSDNISFTLGGYGNLYSYIGFEAGYDPISPIINILESAHMTREKQIEGGWVFSFSIPTAKDIFDVTPLPWAEGRSWAKGIETGISGVGNYYYKEGQGRSEGGLQINKKKSTKRRQKSSNISSGRATQFRNVPYISALINKYNTLFKQLQK